MSFPRSAGSRRRQRSVRVSVAVGLLVVAALVVTGALLLGSLLASSLSALFALLCGVASTRIVLNELAQSRREAARDRAAQARAYQRIVAQQIGARGRFATTMTGRVADRDAEIGRLAGTLGLVKRRAEAAENKVKREARRNVELQERLDEITREQAERDERDDNLAFWDGTDAPTVVDMHAWENRASAASADQAGARRHA